MTPLGHGLYGPQDPKSRVDKIYKEEYYTLLHTNYESSMACGFGEEDFSSGELTMSMRTLSLYIFQVQNINQN